jgi:hypothetical protein
MTASDQERPHPEENTSRRWQFQDLVPNFDNLNARCSRLVLTGRLSGRDGRRMRTRPLHTSAPAIFDRQPRRTRWAQSSTSVIQFSCPVSDPRKNWRRLRSPISCPGPLDRFRELRRELLRKLSQDTHMVIQEFRRNVRTVFPDHGLEFRVHAKSPKLGQVRQGSKDLPIEF